jgi:hypothetical protein
VLATAVVVAPPLECHGQANTNASSVRSYDPFILLGHVIKERRLEAIDTSVLGSGPGILQSDILVGSFDPRLGVLSWGVS